MPRVKSISVAPIIKLLIEMNKVGPEITELLNYCKGIGPDGIESAGPRFNKERLKALRMTLINLGKELGPAKTFVQEIRTSGHFSRNNPTPLALIA